MKSGKHQKGIFLVCEFWQQQGTGFLGLLVFVNPSLGLYICDVCLGFIINHFQNNKAENSPKCWKKISATSLQEQKPILSSSLPSRFRFCITLIDSVYTNSDHKQNGPHRECSKTKNGSEVRGFAFNNSRFPQSQGLGEDSI